MRICVYAEHTPLAGQECCESAQESSDVLMFEGSLRALVALALVAETGDAFERRVAKTLRGVIVRKTYDNHGDGDGVPIECLFCGTKFRPESKYQLYCCDECQWDDVT